MSQELETAWATWGDSVSTNNNNNSNAKIRWAWWLLHSSLGNKSETPNQKKIRTLYRLSIRPPNEDTTVIIMSK